MASRGIRLLSSLIGEGNIRPELRRQVNREEKRRSQSQDTEPFISWPVENRQNIDAIRNVRPNSTSKPDQASKPSPTKPADVEPLPELRNTSNTQASNIPITPFPNRPEGPMLDPVRGVSTDLTSSVLGAATTNEDVPMINAFGDLSSWNFWCDYYAPAENGFENPTLMEDWFGRSNPQWGI